MKNYIFILLFLTLASQTSYSQWQVVNPPPFYNQKFTGITFTDSLNGYLWTFKELYKTTNSGNTWESNHTSGNYSFRNVYFINNDTGFITYTIANYVLRTTDGAKTWHNSFVGSYYFSYVGIHFINSKTGFIVGGGETRRDARKTTNAGESWSYLTHINGFYDYFYDVHFTDSLNGFITSYKYFIRTTDGGQSWYQINLGNNFTWYYELSFINNNTGFVSYSPRNISRTFTSGNAWFNYPITNAASRLYIKAFSNDAVFAMCSKYEIYKTTNLGFTWNLKHRDLNPSIQSSNRLTGIDFYNFDNGFAVGDEKLLKSTDRGESWKSVNDRYELNSIKMKDIQNVLAVGKNGIILKSTDDGISWFNIGDTNFKLDHIQVNLDNTKTDFIIASDSGYVFRSKGDKNWLKTKLSTNSKLTRVIPTNNYNFVTGENGVIFKNILDDTLWTDISPIHFKNIDFTSVEEINDAIFAVGDSGTLLKSNDMGINWVLVDFPSKMKINDISFVNSSKGYIVGDYVILNSRLNFYVTIDGGNSWDSIRVIGHSNKGLDRIKFINENTGFITSPINNYLTTNGGKSWNHYVNYNLRDYDVISFDSAFALRNPDVIYKTSNFSSNFVPLFTSNNSTEIPEEYSLFTFPNPFNPTSKIRFNLIKTEFVTLKIYDISGREITTLIKEKINAGTHEVLFSADEFSLSSGVYFLTMQTENTFLTSKMILLR